MEFFREVKRADVDINALQTLLTINNLPLLCKSINSVILDKQTKGVIYCLWGEFKINREVLKYGIRFSLPDCPNALAWSITTDNKNENIFIHCTINKQEHDEDFIASIEEFIDDWGNGLMEI